MITLRQRFGISGIEITLTVAMNLKSIIALLMGLVIQLSQVQSCVATESGKSCGGNARPMCCCDGLQSCPCAKEGNSDQKSVPLMPATVDLKLLALRGSEPTSPEAFVSPPTDTVVSITPRLQPKSGYAGVPLSVAFCRFVI